MPQNERRTVVVFELFAFRYRRRGHAKADREAVHLLQPAWRALGAHFHAVGQCRRAAVPHRDHLLRRRANTRDRSGGPRGVDRRAVDRALEIREGGKAVGPRQAAVQRLAGVDRFHGTTREITQLHAVAQLVARVDGVAEPAAFVVEREVAHVAHVEAGVGAQLVQQQVGAFHACRTAADRIAAHAGGAGARQTTTTTTAAAATTTAVRFRRVGLHRHPLGRITAERKATDLVELARLAGGEIHQAEPRLHRATLAAHALLIDRLGIDQHRGPVAVAS